MRRSHSNHLVGKAASHRHGCQQKALCHGGAGTVQPQMGDAGVSQGEGGADTLVQKVPGENQINVSGAQAGLVQQLVQGQLLHLLLRLLPGPFPALRASDVEAVAEGTLGLLFTAHSGPICKIDRLLWPECVTAKLVSCHMHPSFRR